METINTITGMYKKSTFYIGRELTYTFAGGFFINAIYYAWTDGMLISQLDNFLMMFSFFVASYFIGYILSEIGIFTKFVEKRFKTPAGFNNEMQFYNFARIVYDEIMKIHERNIFLLHLCSSIGMSFITSSIAVIFLKYVKSCVVNNSWLVLPKDNIEWLDLIGVIFIVILLIAISWFLGWNGQRMYGIIQKQMNDMAEDLKNNYKDFQIKNSHINIAHKS
jgi:hypothetical protein